MVTFLLTMAVLGGLIFAGYRASKYLYVQGALGISPTDTQSAPAEIILAQPVRAAQMEERDYGLRYARIGLVIIAVIMLLIVVGLLFAIFTVL